MITIVFIIDRITGSDGLSGGTERQLIEVISNLDKKEFNPILISLRDTELTTLLRDIQCQKITLNLTRLFSINGLQSILHIVSILKKSSAKIVQTFFFDSTIVGVIASRIAGVKCIISSRRDMGFWYNKKLLLSLFLINKLTHRIFANSNSIRDMITRKEHIPFSKIDVFYNGLDIAKIDKTEADSHYASEINLKSDTIVCGIVANFNRPVKRVDLFIKSAQIALREVSNLKFIIIGSGTMENELRSLANNLGIQHHIYFAGKRDDPLPIMKLFSIGLLTSDSEGLPNTVLQYMGLGIPTISTMAGGVCEIINQGINGILVSCGDEKSIGEAIIRLSVNRGLLNKIGQDARRSSLAYDWPYIIKLYENYYISLLSKQKEKTFSIHKNRDTVRIVDLIHLQPNKIIK